MRPKKALTTSKKVNDAAVLNQRRGLSAFKPFLNSRKSGVKKIAIPCRPRQRNRNGSTIRYNTISEHSNAP